MSSLDEIRKARLGKLDILKKKGLNPYPKNVRKDTDLSNLSKNFSKFSKNKKPISIVGRVMSIRGQGAVVFFDLNDGTAKFQGLCKKDSRLKEDDFELFKNTVDMGDFIEVRGKLFLTKKKEKTIEVENWKMISKSLRPLPEKWHGLQDVEERFRKRYLDLISSSEVRERFIVRSKIISDIRRILDGEGFLEVETPVLQPIYGGASAEPFITHHRALDVDLYLRIAPELYLKRLLVGGISKVYEIARNFRNEGIDMTHNPEFTMLEYYRSYSNADEEMSFVEKMIKILVKNVSKKGIVEFEGEKIDFSKKFNKISFSDLLKEYTQISDPENSTLEDIKNEAKRLEIKIEKGDSKEKIMDNIYKKVCRPKIIQPTFIFDYPANYFPLAKRIAGNEKTADVFQLVISGIELVKAFSELNDPIDQLERLKEQENYKKAGDMEAQSLDVDFVESMEYGMPPSGGVGIGIDRLVMLLTGTRNIREVILFPTLKPKN